MKYLSFSKKCLRGTPLFCSVCGCASWRFVSPFFVASLDPPPLFPHRFAVAHTSTALGYYSALSPRPSVLLATMFIKNFSLGRISTTWGCERGK